MSDKPLLIAVLGPTASGKTALAIDIAKFFCAEIFSADSRQFYKELNIGVAKPTELELTQVRHHFIGHQSIHDDYSAGDYEKDALVQLEKYFEKHKVAVLVGGSGLFVRALLEGLDEFPKCPPELRDQLNVELEEKGLISLANELHKLDPDTYKEIDTQNPRRVIRALEICHYSGKPYSSFKRKQPKQRFFETYKLGIRWERQVLYQRINERCDSMISQGLLDEVEALHDLKHLNALRTVGYQEFFDAKAKGIPLEKAIEVFKTRTRNYAKRQMTWLSKESDLHWFDGPVSTKEVIAAINSFA